MNKQKNRVLAGEGRASANFYESDGLLRHFLQKWASEAAFEYLQPLLERTGAVAATQIDALSMRADKQPPQHIKRDFLGERIDKIEFQPDYWALLKIAIDTQMFRIKWQPELRARFSTERNLMSFGLSYLYAMSESGVYCPLCMTDGAALLLDKHASEADRERLLPHIYADKLEDFYTGAMFLTEKAGGSDVGANNCIATPLSDGFYRIEGEKWFCSNANAQIAFLLARTDETKGGTSGLGIFLIEPQRPDGSDNRGELIRLKDKLGVRSMASGEYVFDNSTWGKLIGEPTAGFRIMTDMINLSRLYNSVAALACLRRGLVEAYQFLRRRISFGKSALQHALVRTKLMELAALHSANFYLTWHCIRLLDAAESGDEIAQDKLRLLTPMTKKTTAADAVYVVRESMELMGGMGYIEDGIMPKLMRDVLVLPIWEGAGNIMSLDMLRAAAKSQGLRLLFEELRGFLHQSPDAMQLLRHAELLFGHLLEVLAIEEADKLQANARPAFEQFARLYQYGLMLHYLDEKSRSWLLPALADWERRYINPSPFALLAPPSTEEIEAALAWG